MTASSQRQGTQRQGLQGQVAQRGRILVVDDDPAMRAAIRRVLAPHYELELVDGVATVEEAFVPGRFDLALLDVQLGDGDGYSLCRWIRQADPETEVVLMTGSVSQPDEKLYRSLEEEAFYFLFKPFERRVLLALLERCLRLRRERRIKERYARELSRDLERARGFQRSLLPDGPVEAGGWIADGRFLPCDALGGDFYALLEERGGDGLVFSVADVVGHGVSAAMVAGMLRSVLDAARRRHPEPDRVWGEILSGVDFFDGPRYATMVFGRLGSDGSVCYFNAGHPPMLLQDRAGAVRELGATGLFVSRLFADRPRRVEEVRMGPGDRLLAYSDGLFEARDPSDRELGLAGVVECLRESRELPLAEALEAVIGALETHVGERPLEDDVTVLLIERRG